MAVDNSRSAAKLFSKDEARRIAANVVKLPELVRTFTRAVQRILDRDLSRQIHLAAAYRHHDLSERPPSAILHSTRVISQPWTVAHLSPPTAWIEKVRSFLLQAREEDHAARLGGIDRVILGPLVVFPE